MMKTLGLLVTTVIALPLGACMHRDDCNSPGWCNDPSPTQVCFYDRDCAPGFVCGEGSCVVRPPVPPPRGQGGAGGYGGSHDGGARDGGAGATGSGGAHPIDAGAPSGTGGAAGGAGQVDAGGSGGTGQPTTDGGPVSTCDGGSGGGGTSGSCRAHPAPLCHFDHECGLSGRCADGECQAACTTNSPCGTGQICSQGYCVTPSTSGGRCIFNADCGSGKTCINGYCHSDCRSDGDCAAPDRCAAGICQPDTGPHPQCLATSDCVGFHVTEDVCVDAVCRTECTSDVDCCVGSSGSVCQMGYCVTSHEVAPQCGINADCGAGRSCIDATCE